MNLCSPALPIADRDGETTYLYRGGFLLSARSAWTPLCYQLLKQLCILVALPPCKLARPFPCTFPTCPHEPLRVASLPCSSCGQEAGTSSRTKVQLPGWSLWGSLRSRPVGRASLTGTQPLEDFDTDSPDSSGLSDEDAPDPLSTFRFPHPLGWDIDSSFCQTSASALFVPPVLCLRL